MHERKMFALSSRHGNMMATMGVCAIMLVTCHIGGIIMSISLNII